MKFSPGILSAENLAVSASFLLGLCGILTIASSQSNASEPLHLAMRQLAFLVFGMGLLFLCSRIRFPIWKTLTPLLAGIALLTLFMLPFFGSRINGMTGWFRIGPLSFQPSETGRPFFLLALVMLLIKTREGAMRFALASAFLLLWLLPICLQPDFGTAVIYALAGCTICFLAGISWKYLALYLVPAAAAAGIILLKYPYVLKRFTGFLNPDLDPLGSGWHVRQFELAVARGGWTGSKMGGAVWSNAYLPFSYNDSAGATLLETLGIAGALVPAVLALILSGALFSIARRSSLSMHARLYAAGTAVFFSLQILIHMGINLALLPPSGLVLPFISYGGSSLAGCCIMTGIVLAAAREKQQTEFKIS